MLGLMMAAVVTTAMAAPQEKPKTMTAQGKVTAVSGDSLTIQKGTESMTFVVDSSTKIVGKGLSTKTAEKTAKGEKMTLTDSVASGDMVTVSYHDMDGKMHASNVKITQKAFITK
jgi:autotransporter adhesin